MTFKSLHLSGSVQVPITALRSLASNNGSCMTPENMEEKSDHRHVEANILNPKQTLQACFLVSGLCFLSSTLHSPMWPSAQERGNAEQILAEKPDCLQAALQGEGKRENVTVCEHLCLRLNYLRHQNTKGTEGSYSLTFCSHCIFGAILSVSLHAHQFSQTLTKFLTDSRYRLHLL